MGKMKNIIKTYLDDIKTDIIFIKKLLMGLFKPKIKMATSGYKCVNCGNVILKIEGSIKHPYCKKCFKKVWNNDYTKYNEWLDNKHG